MPSVSYDDISLLWTVVVDRKVRGGRFILGARGRPRWERATNQNFWYDDSFLGKRRPYPFEGKTFRRLGKQRVWQNWTGELSFSVAADTDFQNETNSEFSSLPDLFSRIRATPLSSYTRREEQLTYRISIFPLPRQLDCDRFEIDTQSCR